jgi:adenylosuccinate synthase
LEGVLEDKNRMIVDWHGGEKLSLQALIDEMDPLAERLAPFVGESVAMLRDAVARGEGVLFEGAQGTFLDIDHGTYPYVTSSNTVAGAACAGAGVGPRHIDEVVGIAKAYTTRVGAGPFPTEMDVEIGEQVREVGKEFGATTGRPRRCGWFDAALVRHAAAINSLSYLALTKLDVLSGLTEIPVCTEYSNYDSPPSSAEGLSLVEPVYETLPGWSEDITGCSTLESLPIACRAYIDRVQELTGVEVGLISVGPGRKQTIGLHPLFQSPGV